MDGGRKRLNLKLKVDQTQPISFVKHKSVVMKFNIVEMTFVYLYMILLVLIFILRIHNVKECVQISVTVLETSGGLIILLFNGRSSQLLNTPFS